MSEKLSRRTALIASFVSLGTLAASSVFAGDKKKPNSCCCCQPSTAELTVAAETRAPNTVCPMYMWGNWGSYCSYYALLCDEGWSTNFDGPCGIPPGMGCGGANCVPRFTGSTSLRGRPQNTRHGRHRDTKLVAKLSWNHKPTPGPDVRIKELGESLAVTFPNEAGTVTLKGKLSLYKVAGKTAAGNRTWSTVAVGQEVEDFKPGESEIENLDVKDVTYYSETNNVVGIVIGTIEYQVVTHTPIR